MSIVFIRVDNLEDGVSSKYLLNCVSAQEATFKAANRKSSAENAAALFATVFCSLLPGDASLSARRSKVDEVLQFIQRGVSLQKYPGLDSSTVTRALSINAKFFDAPYGIFKVLRSPLSLIDPSSSFNVSSIQVSNPLDLSTTVAKFL